MEEILALLGIGTGGLLVGDAFNQLGSIGEQAMSGSADIGNTAVDMVDFTGYGVTGPAGNTAVNPDGSTNFTLDDRGLAFQNMFNDAAMGILGNRGMNDYVTGSLGTASNMLGSIGMDPAQREADIYEALRAVQRPEEQRQGLGLESRAAAQGRTGIRTAMYGGSPEQFAHQKAIAESKNAAAAQALTLAQQQQMQDAQIASGLASSGMGVLGQQTQSATGLGQASFLPNQMLLDQFGAGTQAYGFEDVARRQAASLFAEANMGGLEGLLGSGLGQANLSGQIGAGLLSGGLGALGEIFKAGGSWLDIFK